MMGKTMARPAGGGGMSVGRTPVPTARFGSLKYDAVVAGFHRRRRGRRDVKLSDFKGKPVLRRLLDRRPRPLGRRLLPS
jgi:hypothetical protein